MPSEADRTEAVQIIFGAERLGLLKGQDPEALRREAHNDPLNPKWDEYRKAVEAHFNTWDDRN